MLEIKVGMIATREYLLTKDSVKLFSELSGDKNPIHLDEEYAKNTLFKKCIAPGLQVASFISAVLANDLPGPGTIYLEQSLSFKKPVYVGDKVVVRVSVVELIKSNKARLQTEVLNHSGELVLDGSALVKF